MVLMVGNIRISIEIENTKDKIERSRTKRVYGDVLTEDHVDQVRSRVIRDTMFTRLR
ncbi:MAG: hypothetical protein ACM3ZO_10700 [Clostridia bacterium]